MAKARKTRSSYYREFKLAVIRLMTESDRSSVKIVNEVKIFCDKGHE